MLLDAFTFLADEWQILLTSGAVFGDRNAGRFDTSADLHIGMEEPSTDMQMRRDLLAALICVMFYSFTCPLRGRQAHDVTADDGSTASVTSGDESTERGGCERH